MDPILGWSRRLKSYSKFFGIPTHSLCCLGSAHALRLLLNIERYERVESCTPKFRTTSLPGIKILIYNQTDIPITSLNGVNVPPGFTMDIPFYMKQVGLISKVQLKNLFRGTNFLDLTVFKKVKNI